MVNFSQIANKLKPENVISKIKKYLSRLKIKIRILNKKFYCYLLKFQKKK